MHRLPSPFQQLRDQMEIACCGGHDCGVHVERVHACSVSRRCRSSRARWFYFSGASGGDGHDAGKVRGEDTDAAGRVGQGWAEQQNS